MNYSVHGPVLRAIDLIWDRQFGFLKETLVAPVPRIMIMIGRTVGGGDTVAIFQGLIVVLICLVIGFRPVSWHGMAGGVRLHGAIALGCSRRLGTAIASLLSDFRFQWL